MTFSGTDLPTEFWPANIETHCPDHEHLVWEQNASITCILVSLLWALLHCKRLRKAEQEKYSLRVQLKLHYDSFSKKVVFSFTKRVLWPGLLATLYDWPWFIIRKIFLENRCIHINETWLYKDLQTPKHCLSWDLQIVVRLYKGLLLPIAC